MRDENNATRYAKYSSFYIGGSSTDYTLHISGFSGFGFGDGTNHNGQKFSTKDDDNDANSNNCAVVNTGAWWYGNCYLSNLNGHYGDS